jgi:hypothetical protein
MAIAFSLGSWHDRLRREMPERDILDSIERGCTMSTQVKHITHETAMYALLAGLLVSAMVAAGAIADVVVDVATMALG